MISWIHKAFLNGLFFHGGAVSRNVWLLAAGGMALAGAAAAFFLFRGSRITPPKQAKSEYVDSATCAGCHQEIAKSYRLTGMGRSLYRPRPETTVEDYKTHNSIYNRASDRYCTRCSSGTGNGSSAAIRSVRAARRLTSRKNKSTM